MFVEIADGEFIAVDTIASIRRWEALKETGNRVVFEEPGSGVRSLQPEMAKRLVWSIKTKRGESFNVSQEPYYTNVQGLVNART